MKNKSILVASSTRLPWYENQSCQEHYERHPYSLGAIMFNLEKLGWRVAWSGWQTTKRPQKLARAIDQFKPSIVYTYGSTTALTPLLARRRYCDWKDFKVVHGWDDAYGDIWNDIAGWPGRILMNFMEKRIVTRSDAVVTLSYFLQKRGREWGVDCKYIPNGADIIDRSTVSGDIRLDGKLKLVYTGDQARWKRTADICEAMRHVPKDIKLYLTGQHYKYLDKYASDNCVFLGYLSKAEQFNVMNQADVFVCTADQDCNAKIQEYLRWERPYLGYDGRANLFFKNGENAILCKPEDYPAAIIRLADNPALRAQIAANAKRDIPLLSWAEIAAKFDAAFQSFIKPL